MSCTDNTKNTDIKIATYNSLNNLYNFKPTDELKPNSYDLPFSDIAVSSASVILANINTNLDDLENLNKNNLFIKDNITSNIYQNCVIQTNNPWFTTSSDYKKCEIIKNIVLDDKLKLNADKTIINLDLKSKNKSKTAYCPYFSNVNHAYCENRWYDWIITPDYYLGNIYNKNNTKFGDNDVYKCYKPCEIGYIPHKTEKNEFKCIPKKYYAGGIFANKLEYSPIGLINLIGNVAFKNDDKEILKLKNKNLLYILYKNIIDYNIENKIDDNIYEPNIIYNDFINNSSTDINEYFINDFNKDIYNEFEKTIKDNILNDFSYSNDQDYANINQLTYKHKNFNENEPEMYTFKGLDTSGILIPPILYHTFLLANIFIPLSEDNISNITNAADITTEENANKFINAYTNFDTNDINTFITASAPVPAFANLLNRNLFDKLNKIFDIDKSNRLKNIFYKAVNVCYNGKTNFSINIIEKTKNSLNIYKDKNTYVDFLTNLGLQVKINFDDNNIKNNIKNNIIFNNEYKYYKDYELYDLSNSYDSIRTNKPNNAIILDTLLNDDNKYKYFFSVEKLERPTCENGYIYNSKIRECEPEPEKVIEDKNAPIEDDFDQFNIPNIKNILIIFLKIVLVIIILYIVYIFYDIFGETILTVYNYLYMKYIEMTAFISRNEQISLASNDEEVNKINADIDYKLAMVEYQNLNKNTQKIKTYINENKDKYDMEANL
jgi:hypothetical protein